MCHGEYTSALSCRLVHWLPVIMNTFDCWSRNNVQSRDKGLEKICWVTHSSAHMGTLDCPYNWSKFHWNHLCFLFPTSYWNSPTGGVFLNFITSLIRNLLIISRQKLWLISLYPCILSQGNFWAEAVLFLLWCDPNEICIMLFLYDCSFHFFRAMKIRESSGFSFILGGK